MVTFLRGKNDIMKIIVLIGADIKGKTIKILGVT
jgi:hypothetical protein